MARRSSLKEPGVSQMYDIGCSWRLYRIFNFRGGQVIKRFVSNTGYSSLHDIGNRSSRSRPDVLTTADEKHPHNHIDVSSKRRSCVKNDQVAAVQGIKATDIVVDQNFLDGRYLCEDGGGSQPHEFYDALRIVYSNTELFLKLLRDPASPLVKQIYDFKISPVKEQYQAGHQMRSAYKSTWVSSQKSYATRCETKNFADPGFRCPLHSHGTYSYNAKTVKHSRFLISHIKRKLRHAMGGRKRKQQRGTVDGVSRKFPCKCQGVKDGDKAMGLEGVGRNSPSSDHSGFAKGRKLSPDFKKRDKMMMKIKDFTSCIGQDAASVSESCGRNMTQTSVSPSEKNIQNMHPEATKNLSVILNCRIEEQNNNEPSVAIKTVSDQLRCFGTNVRKSPPDYNLLAYYGIPIGSDKLLTSGYDLHPREIRHMEVPSEQDSINMDSPPSFDMDIATEGTGSVMDSPHEIENPSFSPEVASSSSSSYQSVDSPVNLRNTVYEHPSIEPVVEQIIREEVTNPTTIIAESAELPIQAMHYEVEEPHFADLVRSSSDPMNNLITSTDMSESDYDREIVQALSLKWDELVKCGSPEQLLDQSTIEELKGLTSSTVLFDSVIEVFMEIYQHFCIFPSHISIMKPNVQANVLKRIMVHEVKEVINLHHHQYESLRTLLQLTEKDLARRGSWLNVQVDTEYIAIQVEEDILQEMVLEIVSEMDSRSVIHTPFLNQCL